MGCGYSKAPDVKEKPEKIIVVEQPQPVLEIARTSLENSVVGIPVQFAPGVVQPTVSLERALAIIGGHQVNIRRSPHEVPFDIELTLEKPSLLTELEVASEKWPMHEFGFELYVADALVAKASFAHFEERYEPVSLCRMTLDQPIDNVSTITLRATPGSASLAMDSFEIDKVVPRGLPVGSALPRRRLLRPPPYWSTVEGTVHSRVDVTAPEHVAFFQRLLDETWKSRHTRDRKTKLPTGLLVRKVQRVEAPSIWNNYSRHRRQMSLVRGARCTPVEAFYGTPEVGRVRTKELCESAPAILGPCEEAVNEHYLFHGTSPEGALGIIREGFDMSKAGTSTGLMFGPGAYFAESSSKFDEYAKPDEFSGLCAVLCCRVACGELYRTLGDLSPDVAAEPKFRKSYDGILGDREAAVGTYREFVIFRQEQVYPEYLVFYDREFND